MALPNPGHRENGVVMAGATTVVPGSPSPTGILGAVDELDVELRYIADAQRRVAVEVHVFHLAASKAPQIAPTGC
jgi:hypothetical protein